MITKVGGSSSLQQSSAARRKRLGGGGDFGRLLIEDQEVAADAVSHTAPINAVDALIALQSVGDESGGQRRKAMRQGEHMLDSLDKIRQGLLMGTIPGPDIIRLKETVKREREQVNDPRLIAILDEIQLRAEVELAKLEMSGWRSA